MKRTHYSTRQSNELRRKVERAKFKAPTKYYRKLFKSLSLVWYVIPLLLLVANMSTRALFYNEIEETTGVGVSDWCICERVRLTQWWHLVAFTKSTHLLHQAKCAVLYRRIVMASKMASKLGKFHIIVLLIVALAAAGANTERVVFHWRRPVASSEALVMLHWAMRSISFQCAHVVIKMACNRWC